MSATGNTWFDGVPVLGALTPDKALAKLRELGERKLSDQIRDRSPDDSAPVDAFGGIHLLPEKAWQHTEHAFGYIKPRPAGQTKPIHIQHTGNIRADQSLKNSRITITLDRLRIADYPGGGTHLVLFDFYAQNQLPSGVEHLHFNATYRGREGEHVAVVGCPIFVGLNVSSEGVVFKCFTVNIKNDDDENLLQFLDSSVFKVGLRLASTFQPAIAPLSEMAFGLTKAVAMRRRNVPVQDFHLGLSFSDVSTCAHLAEGSYVAVQVSKMTATAWDWTEWVYSPKLGQIVSASDPTRLMPYNYIVFGVSRYEEGGEVNRR